MQTNSLYPTLNLKSFFDFAKMNKDQQKQLLDEKGVLLDCESEKEITTSIYFLQGFFVEQIYSKSQKEITDMIPFKQGYRIESFIKSDSCSINERPMHFQYCIN